MTYCNSCYICINEVFTRTGNVCPTARVDTRPIHDECGDFDTNSNCVKSSRRSQPYMNTFLSGEKGAPASDGNVTLPCYRRVAPYKLPLMSILLE
jgi:hypothetical protein